MVVFEPRTLPASYIVGDGDDGLVHLSREGRELGPFDAIHVSGEG